jgi:hypothetical protein
LTISKVTSSKNVFYAAALFPRTITTAIPHTATATADRSFHRNRDASKGRSCERTTKEVQIIAWF